MPEKQNLYFIAIIPPQEVCDAITIIREDFADRFESKKALKVIPHITLKAPFKLPAADHEKILEWFKEIPVDVPSFQQELKDFGAFHNKGNPVIFVHPIMNPMLHNLQKEVLQNFRKAYPKENIMKLEFDFKPHITVAYRDLSPGLFQKAWKEYQLKRYAATFTVTGFHFLQHDGSMWNTVSTFFLK